MDNAADVIPTFAGPVDQLRQATQGGSNGVSIGMVAVRSDSATFSVSDGSRAERLTLAVGESGEATGLGLRLCATWIDSGASDMPGGDGSTAYFVTGPAGDVPDCPDRR